MEGIMKALTVELTLAELELLREALDRKSEREHDDAQAAADLSSRLAREIRQGLWVRS